MRATFLVSFLTALLLAVPSALAADTQEVEAQGEAVIYSGDTAAARDKAIADALRKAVEQAVGTMISSTTVTQNFQLVEDRILSKASGYIKKYSIASQGQDGQTFKVTVKAVVGTAGLAKDVESLQTLLQQKGMPRVLIMVAEQNVGQPGPSYWWGNSAFSASLDAVENGFMQDWLDKGFTFVDRQALAGKIKVSNALKSITPSDDAVKEFAGKTGAELVIVGQAIATDMGTVMDTKMHSVRAQLSVRALRIDNGQVLATSTQNAGAVHIDTITAGTQALQKAAKQMGDELLERVTKVWSREVSGPATITLTIKNVSKASHLKKLTAVLGTKVRGVEQVRQRSFGDKVAVLELDIKGTAQDLAVELEEKDFEKFELEIAEVTANTVTARLKGE